MKDEKRSAKFAIYFIAGLLAVSAGVFVIFTYVQRTSAEERRQMSAAHLVEIHRILLEASKKTPGIEFSAGELTKLFDDPRILINPAWPELPGYSVLSGLQPGRDAADMPLVFENVPENKRRLGLRYIDLGGHVSAVEGSGIDAWFAAQRARFGEQKIRWAPQEIHAAVR